ncbi:MAG: site-specific integrase [Pseudomonadota bacterium]|nr:site-specific integrase [Pseudomonadota bacterium]
MAKSSIRITKRVVTDLKATGVDRFVWDNELIGFGVRVSPKGLITYIYQYFLEGRTRRFKIGIHGVPWTPETARQEATRLAGLAVSGDDPQQAKIEQRKAMIVAELCDLYLTEGLLTRKESSVSSARGDIENHIKPLLGTRKVASLERADLETMMRDIAAGKTARTAKLGTRRLSRVRGGKGAASSALTVLSAALGFGVVRKVRADNLALGIRKFPGKKIERFLSPAELARLGEALSAASALGVESPYAIAALRLLILTGCRKNEILTLKRPHVDAYHRCLRLPDSKTGSKIVHLGAPAVKVIGAIHEVAGNPYLLPGRNEGTHVTDLQSCWERIRKTAGLEDVRIHDLRHSFASMGAASGDSLMVIGALLGHRSAKTTERYAHLSDHPVKAAADRIADGIARHLDQALATQADPAGASDAADPFDKYWESPAAEAATAFDPILGAVIRTEWCDTRAAAARLGFTVGTMQTYRWMGTGPAFRKIGRRVVYSVEALNAWSAVQRETERAIPIAA